jgi:hypothetical protein
VTTAYRIHNARILELHGAGPLFIKQFGRTLVTAEAEAKFRQLAAEGKLVWPEGMKVKKPGPKERAAAAAKEADVAIEQLAALDPKGAAELRARLERRPSAKQRTAAKLGSSPEAA